MTDRDRAALSRLLLDAPTAEPPGRPMPRLALAIPLALAMLAMWVLM